jgi:hypothetical protein
MPPLHGNEKMESVFYYELTLHKGAVSSKVVAPVVKLLPPTPLTQVMIVTSTEGNTQRQGAYLWDLEQEKWRFALPYQPICDAIIYGAVIDLFYDVSDPDSGLASNAQVWRNGIEYAGGTTFTVNDGSVYGATTAVSFAAGEVKSVNNKFPNSVGAVEIDIADIPNLQQELDNAGKVKTVDGQQPDANGNIVVQASDNNAATGTSLISDSGSTTGNIKLKTLVAGSNITIAPDANGNLRITGTVPPPPVTSVSGQTGAVVISTVNNNGATGTSLISDSGATTGTAKLKTLVAGSLISFSTDANGNLVISSTATSGALTAVNNEGTGTGLVDNNGTAGGIATIKSLAAGSNVTITPSGDGKTLTIAANQAITPATTSAIGGVIIGAGINVDGTGKISLAPPTGVNLGGVKAGTGITIAGDGTISATGAVASVSGQTGAGVRTNRCCRYIHGE